MWDTIKSAIKKQEFTIIMCFCMVSVMNLYNTICNMGGFTAATLPAAAQTFVICYVVALCGDIFIAGPGSNRLLAQREWKHPLIMKPVFMVCHMVPYMSLYGMCYSIIAHGAPVSSGLSIWVTNLGRNVIMAMPLSVLIVSPFVRRLFAWKGARAARTARA